MKAAYLLALILSLCVAARSQLSDDADEPTNPFLQQNPHVVHPTGTLIFDAPSLPIYYNNATLPLVLTHPDQEPIPSSHSRWGKTQICLELVNSGSLLHIGTDRDFIGLYDLDQVITEPATMTSTNYNRLDFNVSMIKALTPDTRFYIRGSLNYEHQPDVEPCAFENPAYYSTIFAINKPQWLEEGLNWT